MQKFKLAVFLLISLACQSQILIKYSSYDVYYDTIARIPRWSHYVLKPEHLNGTVKRTLFENDLSLPSRIQAHWIDYEGSGWDKGHLAPNEDFRWSAKSQKESMLFTNCAPQQPSLNRGMWKSLEHYVRSKAKNQQVEIWTGTLSTKRSRRIGSVVVPHSFWKLIRYVNVYEAWIVPNSKPSKQSTLAAHKIDPSKLLLLIKQNNSK